MYVIFQSTFQGYFSEFNILIGLENSLHSFQKGKQEKNRGKKKNRKTKKEKIKDKINKKIKEKTKN
jgi:hypothetical protein